MRKPPAHPCPACGRARHRFRSGDLAVLCKQCWYAVSDEVRAAYGAAGRAYLKNRRAELGNHAGGPHRADRGGEGASRAAVACVRDRLVSNATDPRRGDGFTSTHALRPCTCPKCGGELMITCPNACADAADGVDGHVSPAALLPRPSGRDRLSHAERARRDAARESQRAASRVRGVNGTGTKGQIMAALRGAPTPLTVPKIAARLKAPYGRISMALGSLVREGHVVRIERGEYRAT